MKTGVVVFPGSNCDRDMAVALQAATGQAPARIWHKDTALPAGLDLIALPGGFAFGDYLRPGAIAARAPVMAEIVAFAQRGGLVLGVCNGFQVLLETGLLPGALMRNAGLRFVCRPVALDIAAESPFTAGYATARIALPVAHHDGNYIADAATLDRLADENRIAFRYAPGANPNGSMRDIAGILSTNRRVLGLMPHPERAADPALGPADGLPLFQALAGALPAV